MDVTEERWSYKNEDEWLFWPRVLWIDPGGVSGVACIWFDPLAVSQGQPLRRSILAWHERFLHGPRTGRRGQISSFLRLQKLLAQEPGLAVGVEDFVVRQANMSREFLDPVRINEPIIWYNSIKGRDTHVQSPSDAKNTFDDGRLKEMGMYTPGPDHVRDATRHCLLHIRKMKDWTPKQIAEYHGYDADWYQNRIIP